MNEHPRSAANESSPPPSDRSPASESGVGGVEMERVRLIREPQLEESEPFRQMNDRLRASEALVASLRPPGPVATDLLLTAALDTLVDEGKIDGLLVGSEDGFVVAQSAGMGSADLLAVIGTVFDFVSRRVQAEGLMPRVDEMSARGTGGEQIILRYFPGTESRFFLLAYSRQPATYRRTMARALKRCGDILAGRTTVPQVSRRSPGLQRTLAADGLEGAPRETLGGAPDPEMRGSGHPFPAVKPTESSGIRPEEVSSVFPTSERTEGDSPENPHPPTSTESSPWPR